MRYILLVASVAAMAIAAPAAAQKGGNGGGKGGGGGKPAKVERGGGGGGGGQQARAQQRGSGGGEFRQRGPERREARGQAQRGPERRQARTERVRGPEKRQVRVERVRGPERREARVERSRGNDRVRAERPVREARVDRVREREVVRLDRREDTRQNDYSLRYADNGRTRGRTDGCPPGLAAKNNGCLPPGQAKQFIGHALPVAYASSLLPATYRTYYPDSDDYYYREGDGLIYRVARSTGLVDGYSPLWGYGADYTPDYYYPGEAFPVDYVSFYNVPEPYQRYYQDEADWMYRYGDGGIYRVNRDNGLVDGIVALLAGDLAVGQQLPAGYDVYNVPYGYRDEYYDTDEHLYRYNDGYIYQVDPTTRLVQAVIEALV